MIGLLVEVEPVGPISVNLPMIARSGGSFLLPPPTTLMGALAFAYMKGTGRQAEIIEMKSGVYSSAVLLLDKVLYACAGTRFYVYTRHIERVFTITYQKDTRREQLERYARGEKIKNSLEFMRALRLAYGVGSRGALLTDKLYIFYIVRDEDLVHYANSIVRIGSKESRVIVRRVVKYDNIESLIRNVSSVKTIFYLPKCLALRAQNAEEVEMPTLQHDNFGISLIPKTEWYIVPKPYSLNPMIVDLNERKAVALYLEDVDSYVVIDRDLLTSKAGTATEGDGCRT